MAANTKTLEQRINEYLCKGGLFNPELMAHDKVRDLLIDCRDALLAAPSSPAPDDLTQRPENKAETHLYEVVRILRGNPSLPESMLDSAVSDYFAAAVAHGQTLMEDRAKLAEKAYVEDTRAFRATLSEQAQEIERLRTSATPVVSIDAYREATRRAEAAEAEVTRLKTELAMLKDNCG